MVRAIHSDGLDLNGGQESLVVWCAGGWGNTGVGGGGCRSVDVFLRELEWFPLDGAGARLDPIF